MPFGKIRNPKKRWGNWLKDKVNFSHQTANKFMKCATEFSNSSLTSNLGTGKLFELLDLPIENREDFINSTHEINGIDKTVEEMTQKELQRGYEQCSTPIFTKNKLKIML
ncbi:hypothetical protein CLOBY_17840 [Clostridium saccharobutylicum]|uniref:DUF3102 domain-containing protein n=1 Tax=Clostridium saccharobutylicum TaxID=169679 RepID=UPI000983C2CA|nr:DUF3102 domain-containing protein [Clostridium saccharobutylicum]AQS09653.1 hypothetical protein CLOBY_17840 [Clostridium saccharobutylicum]MBC2438815.1 DUF3102 domain-containing protein [Clostridium saccharobutylicum]NSB91092.1 hypothetical protein [Clostridium saccharobutylicum]NYC27959.1 hypothetical protein [Clostridium saccharobutylicum]OOM12962.1 hypothetical protein CLSAB_36530 [Clostridium saccharobutylicum]